MYSLRVLKCVTSLLGTYYVVVRAASEKLIIPVGETPVASPYRVFFFFFVQYGATYGNYVVGEKKLLTVMIRIGIHTAVVHSRPSEWFFFFFSIYVFFLQNSGKAPWVAAGRELRFRQDRFDSGRSAPEYLPATPLQLSRRRPSCRPTRARRNYRERPGNSIGIRSK